MRTLRILSLGAGERLMFLHRSCVPLEEADLRDRDRRIGQTIMSFDTECLGMCGN